jgi:hypothetical protein
MLVKLLSSLTSIPGAESCRCHPATSRRARSGLATRCLHGGDRHWRPRFSAAPLPALGPLATTGPQVCSHAGGEPQSTACRLPLPGNGGYRLLRFVSGMKSPMSRSDVYIRAGGVAQTCRPRRYYPLTISGRWNKRSDHQPSLASHDQRQVHVELNSGVDHPRLGVG